MDLKDCIEKQIIKKVSIDKEMARSLEKDANNKILTSKKIKLNKESATSIITLLYDALRQKLEKH